MVACWHILESVLRQVEPCRGFLAAVHGEAQPISNTRKGGDARNAIVLLRQAVILARVLHPIGDVTPPEWRCTMRILISRGIAMAAASFALGLVLAFAHNQFTPIASASDPNDWICDEVMPCGDCVPCDPLKYPPGQVLCTYYEGTWYNTKTHQYGGCCGQVTGQDPDCHYPW